jgi:murein DD-endopeptidase MepM/ murein hydrolase activator NlpD
MKKLFILIFFFALQATAQQKPFINLDSIKAFVERDSLRKDSIKQHYLSTHWDNKRFDPYKDEMIEFPFNINFEDVFYASPIAKDYVITSRYGWRWGRAHKGIDIDLITGDEVYAVLDGKVRYVGYHSGHGRTVIIRHYNGLETVYAHLSRYKVKVNDIVKKGQVIAKGGNTGNSRGSHLHLETKYKGQHINPEYIFSFDDRHKINKPIFWVTKDWVTPFLHNSRRASDFVYYSSREEAESSEGIQLKVYVVKRGDTLYDISRKYNVSISRICKANSIRINSTLKIGQELVL